MASANLTKPAVRVALATALLLLVPLAAMQFTSEVSWAPGDFLAAAALRFSAGMVYVAWAQHARTRKQRVVIGLVVLTALATIWADLAVGLFT